MRNAGSNTPVLPAGKAAHSPQEPFYAQGSSVEAGKGSQTHPEADFDVLSIRSQIKGFQDDRQVKLAVMPSELTAVANAMSLMSYTSGSAELNKEAAVAHDLAEKAWKIMGNTPKVNFHNAQVKTHLRAAAEIIRSQR